MQWLRPIALATTVLALAPAPAFALDLAAYRRPAVRAAIARLTRDAIWAHVRHAAPPTLPTLPELQVPAGVFVTLSRDGQTRGCWGTVQPRRASLAEELADVAVNVLSHDPRHQVVRSSELAGLVARVSVVGDLEAVDGPTELLPRRYGLLVAGQGKGGVLLPGEAATATWQVWTCRRKAGLRPHERASLYRFETAVVGPVPLAATP